MSEKSYFHEFYVVWESSCRNFIEDINFASQEAKSSIRLYIFLRKDTPSKALPPSYSWIEKHYSLTTSPYASHTELTACLLRKYGKFDHNRGEKVPERRVYLVAERDREYEELIAILKAFNSVVSFQEINGLEMEIWGVLPNSCHFCRLLFTNAEDVEAHNVKKHDNFCDNTSCYRHLRRFRCKEDLDKHKATRSYCETCNELFCSDQLKMAHMAREHGVPLKNNRSETNSLAQPVSKTKISCKFCPGKEFISWEQEEIHMKLSHKKCNCSCAQYFATREEYLEHFYSVYPLPCYENRKCPQRFRSVHYQALHHREVHNSPNPFYCVPCHKRKLENKQGRGTKTSFKDDKSLRIHGSSIGHNETEMFLIDLDDHGAMATSETAVHKRSPARTCSNLNYF